MDTVEKIKEKLSIVDVVGQYVKLTKAGRHWRGLSPFNKEKTPSFYVNIERNSYYCFSSQQGGDMFTFIEKMEGVDFKGALKILAEKAGVEIVYQGQSARKEDAGAKDRLRLVLSKADLFFQEQFQKGTAPYQYALSRGLSEESLTKWGIGYAPDGWRTLLEYLTTEGFSIKEMLAGGLIKEADEKPGTYYDRFRNRVMFPIRDTAGRTVAFTGRALDPNDQAKYLNSPETELYKKSEILFGMDKAKDAIRQRGFAVLVEGQMDLLLLHQIGFENTVALSGTALTPTHLSLIRRYADNLMLALDADRAGLAASQKHGLVALASGMRVKAVRLPEGKDPADVSNDDPKDMTKRIAESVPIVEFFISVLQAKEPDLHKLILAVERIVLPLVRVIQSPLEREHFITFIARALDISPESIKAGLARIPKEAGEEVHASQPMATSVPSAPPQSNRERYELRILATAAAYPDTALANRLKSEYSRITSALRPDELIPEALVFEAGIAFGEAPDEHAADDLIRAFEKATLTERFTLATLKLRKAEAAKDTVLIEEAAKECQTLATLVAKLS